MVQGKFIKYIVGLSLTSVIDIKLGGLLVVVVKYSFISKNLDIYPLPDIVCIHTSIDNILYIVNALQTI